MAETDLERFVEAPGRDEQVKAVREKIDALGIEYLYGMRENIDGDSGAAHRLQTAFIFDLP